MLYWEAERPELGVVHHLMVLGYHLQHPHLYSAAGLAHAKGLLVDFVERGVGTEEMRRKQGSRVASDKREWKVTARPGDEGSYPQPVAWSVTAADVVAGGMDGYVANTQRWAAAILQDLKLANNIP
jgi:hypothetical protein